LKTQSSLNKVLKNAGILLSGNMAANILGFLSLAIFTHSQGAAIFGYYVLFITFVEIIDRIFNFQTWQAFIKFATDFQVKNEEHNVMMLLKYSFLVDLISLMVATLVALVLSFYAIEFFEIPQEYYQLLLLMTLTILFKTTEISTGVFRLFDKFKIQAKITVYAAAFKFVLFIVVALVAPSFEVFVYATALSQFVTMVMKFFYAKKILNNNDIKLIDIKKEKINMSLLKELKIFSFIVYNNFDVAVRMVSRQSDVVILGKLYGPEIVGIYKIAKEVANLIAKFTDPVYQAIYPEFAKLLANGKKIEAKVMAKKVSIYAGITGLTFYCLFAIFGKFSIELAFGVGFSGAYDIALVYFVAIFIGMITLPLYPMQHAFGYAKYAFTNQLHATLIYLPISFALIIYFEMVGASMAYIFYYVYLSGLTLKSVRKGFK
jgi:O-antigen/teichoic acid export membrane protein